MIWSKRPAPTLFDLPPAARTTDPQTSHDAAVEHDLSGDRARHCGMILNYVARYPGLTCREIALGLPMEAYAVSKRLSDLSAKGLIRPTAERSCKVTGRKARAWAVTE